MSKDEDVSVGKNNTIRPCKFLLVDDNYNLLKETEFNPVCLQAGYTFSLTVNYTITE